MSKEKVSHGRKLTLEEYEKAIIDLHSGSPPKLSKKQDRSVRLKELHLAIDHYLGCDFPAERREALWAIQEKIERKRLRLALKYFFRKLFHKSLYHNIQGLMGFMVDEYSKALNDSELQQFLDLQEGEEPMMPIDRDQLKK